MRFLLAIVAVWFAILLFPERPRASESEVKEKVWLSRTCPDSHWYLDSSDDQSATLVCYALKGEPSEDGK
jgi:hypothetical protein